MNKLIVGLLLFFFDALLVMLGIGVVHAAILPAVMPAGYGTACLLTLLFGIGAAQREKAIVTTK